MSTVLVTNSTAQLQINGYNENGIIDESFIIPIGPQALALPTWVTATTDYASFLADAVFTKITEASSTTLVGTLSSQNSELVTTGSPTTALISNPGNQPAWILLGSSSVTVSPTTGVLVAPGASVSLAIASNTYLAYIGATVLQVVLGS